MAIIIGSVVVDSSGTETTKTGEVGHLYDLMMPIVLSGLSDAGITLAGAQLQKAKQAVAAQALVQATWIVQLLTARAAVVVPGTLGALQKSTAVGTVTNPSGADVSLAIS